MISQGECDIGRAVNEKLRIISWNCQGAFRKKMESVLSWRPDILIIQECEELSKLKFPMGQTPSFQWRSSAAGMKGLAVFGWDCEINNLGEETEFRHIVPFSVRHPRADFTLFAVWAMDSKADEKERYIGQVWKAVRYYKDMLKGNPCIMIGDFNSNKIWDHKPRCGNHSAVVELLRAAGLESLYHLQEGIPQGEEETPTFFLYRSLSRPYHIDYCFMSKRLRDCGASFHIGTPDMFLRQSDHMPIRVDLALPT